MKILNSLDDASKIKIIDVEGKFVADNVEDALIELSNTKENIHNISQYTIPRRSGAGSGPTDSYMEYSSLPAADTIARRSSAGILRGNDPVAETDLINKRYFEANLPSIDMAAIFNAVYPVGVCYVSSDPTSPEVLFGGTWVSLKDRVIVGAGGLYAVNATGGAATHVLTSAEMPVHTHVQNDHNHAQDAHNHSQNAHNHLIDHDYDGAGGSNRYTVHNPGYAAGGVPTSGTTATNNAATATNQAATATNQNAGGGNAHNNMPPFIAKYAWERTA